jgi:hypothetical protein
MIEHILSSLGFNPQHHKKEKEKGKKEVGKNRR